MAGYAFPVGVANSDTGTATSVTVNISSSAYNVVLFTATQKTKVNSILTTNISGGILPVSILVNRGGLDLAIAKTRVLDTKYVVLPLVSGDTRTNDDPDQTIIEFTLQAGDVLKAACPVEDVINVTVNLTEGVK
jgi:hypothetical protein